MTEENRVSELDNVCALDLETSGLAEQGDQILEVAAIFGSFINGVFVEKRRCQIVLPIMSNVEDWHEKVLEMHTANGLFVEAMAARKARAKFSSPMVKTLSAYEDADSKLGRVAPLLPGKAKWTLLGNSVHFDLRFVRRCFPTFANLLSHRVIDVSSIRLFCESLGRPYVQGEPAHRAMADVEASLAEFAACQSWIKQNAGRDSEIERAMFRQDIADREALACVVGHGAG